MFWDYSLGFQSVPLQESRCKKLRFYRMKQRKDREALSESVWSEKQLVSISELVVYNSRGICCLSWNTKQCPEAFLLSQLEKGKVIGAIGVWWIEAKDAVKHPVLHRKALSHQRVVEGRGGSSVGRVFTEQAWGHEFDFPRKARYSCGEMGAGGRTPLEAHRLQWRVVKDFY